MTQNKLIATHLLKHKNITSIEALHSYGCFRLAARIKNLRDLGYPITTRVKRDATGRRYASYTLEGTPEEAHG